jgi:hypothetical protein
VDDPVPGALRDSGAGRGVVRHGTPDPPRSLSIADSGARYRPSELFMMSEDASVNDAWVPVLDLTRHGRVYSLSHDTGRAVASDAVRVHGMGLPYPKPFSALYACDDKLWIRVGLRRWDVRDLQEVRQLAESPAEARYEFLLRNGTTDQVSIRFPPGVRLIRTIDVTHDEIDSWSEDIVKALPYVASDGWKSTPSETFEAWMARTLHHWRSGVSSRT